MLKPMRFRHWLPWVAWTLTGLAAPPSPTDFQLDSRLEIRLWAAEPDVIDPVAMAFDERGRAWIAECRDYPYGAGPEGQAGSTIRLLEDVDRDGRVDRSTLFARDLSYVTSVTPWRGGVLVAAAPEILYLKDTNGDGQADVREALVTGFLRGVSDSLVNGLRFGPDSRIHGANGGNGGRLRSPRSGTGWLDLGENDFAFDPDTGRVGLTGRTGGGFGLVFDDWGHPFTTYNIDHIQHRYLDLADYRDQPGFPDIPTTTSISDHGEMARIFPVSDAVTRPNHPEQSGYFSAAGGMGHLSAAGWPQDLQGAVFVCDVVGNLVHREVIQTRGSAFVASRATKEPDHEFLASRDPNFRPVGLEHGPDGALYLLDMQRDVIEHPDYIPAKLRAKQDIRAGADRGRIWRIAPRTWGTRPPSPVRLDDDTTLVELLAHPDQWWRVTAQRLLIERRATHVRGAILRQMTNHTGSPATPSGRVHALWTLGGLGLLSADSLALALADPSPGVREAALRWVATHPGYPSALLPTIQSLTRDPSPRVRFQATLALKGSEDPVTADALRQLLAADAGDPWIRRAVLAVLHSSDKVRVLNDLLTSASFTADPGAGAALGELAELLAADPRLGSSEIPRVGSRLRADVPRAARLEILRGLARGMKRRDEQPVWNQPDLEAWRALEEKADDEELAAVWKLASLGGDQRRNPTRMAAARSRAMDRALPVASRIQSMDLISLESDASSDLVGLLDGREPSSIQLAAMTHLRNQSGSAVGPLLINQWRTLGPEVRPRALALLLERRALHDVLLSALEARKITAGELSLDLEQRRRLLRSSNRDTATRAARFFSDEEYSNRRQLVDEWLTQLPKDGDAANGRAVFQQACAQCHQCGNLGIRVGPDLSGVAHRSIEDLLGNILDPNMAINPGFVAYQIGTRDGESHVGLLAQDAPDQVTLVQAAGQRIRIARKDVVQLESSGLSLMPEGLEAGRSPKDLRDLIAFIQTSR